MNKVNFELLNKSYIIIGLVILFLGFGTTYSENSKHGGNRVFIIINGNEKSLQSAINDGDFSSKYSGAKGYGKSINFGHKAENIFVHVDGVDKSFQDAINDGSLCSFTGGNGNYSGDIYFGHNAEDILIDFKGEKSLQQAINEGLFLLFIQMDLYNPLMNYLIF